MNYIEYKIDISNKEENFSDILLAFLSELGFDSFSEENNFLCAYISEKQHNKKDVSDLLRDFNVEFSLNFMEQKNWNEEWEKNYEPIIIEELLSIKAPFHKQNFNTKYCIEIEPKMSFGTGHHPTTKLMCKLIDEFDFNKKSVLDMGCGTGILAIFAALKGAENLVAIDIEEWAAENTIENAKRNNINRITVICGDKNNIPAENFDFIFANINLNVLKKDIPDFEKHLNTEGFLLLSGFFISETVQIVELCEKNSLKFIKCIEEENWTGCLFKKI